nr:ATP-dependent DNA helicase PIF1-like [Tanacetum cinerariifolium]
MVRSMMSQTTLPKSFWDYALETAARILNMVPTKKGCEALVKRDTLTKPNKLKPRSIKCIFVGYPKEMMGYSFYYPPENKVLVARNAEFLENSLIDQEDDLEIDEPQSDTVPIRRSMRIRHAPDRMCLYIVAEEHELGDLGEPANYKAALLDPESKKWLNAINVEMQSMKDNEVWVLVERPPNGKTVGREHQVMYDEYSNLETVIHKPSVGQSMFEGWMKMNDLYPAAREVKYVEFPTKHKNVNGVIYPTYKEACYATGLLEDDKEYVKSIKDVAHWESPEQLRQLFVTLLSQKELTTPLTVRLQTGHLLAHIASLLMSGGRTVHSKFHIPINVDETSHCSISAQSDLGTLLKRCKLIIWDEAPMANKLCFEALDRSLRDILLQNMYDTCERPFGNMTMVFGGDFRQVLSVVPKGSRQDIVSASLKESYLWDHCNVLKLTANMRLTVGARPKDVSKIREFAEWILKIGDGELGEPNDGEAILAPTNEVVDNINDHLLEKFLGEEMVYLSCDSVDKTERNATIDQSIFSPEFINGLMFSCVPNHRLPLKVGVPIMLLRNIDQPNGLCNRTRLQVLKLTWTYVSAQIINATHFEKKVII